MTCRRLIAIPCVASLLLLILAVCPTVCQAQAADTADTRARIYAFGMLSYVNPKFGGAKKNAGATVGGDFNFSHFGHFEPGFELRALGSGGRLTRQYNYAGGPRIQYNWNRLHSYAEFLIGYGQIKFERPILGPKGLYVSDTATTYNYGAGLDYSVTDHWAARADYFQQSWHFDPSPGPFRPWAVSVGVRYQFIFKSMAYPTAR